MRTLFWRLITFTLLPLLPSVVMSQRKRSQSLEPPLGVELVLGLIAVYRASVRQP